MRTEPSLRHQCLITAGLHGIALILLGLHLYVRTLPPTPTPIPAPDSAEAAWWGFWPVTYAPTWAVTVGTVLVLASILWFWLREGKNWQSEHTTQTIGTTHYALRTGNQVVLIFLSIILTIAFFAFPITHTRWGDAYLLSKAIAWPDPALRLTYSWQAPLDVWLHSQVWLVGQARFGWIDAIPVYRLLSPLAGSLYLVVVLALTRNAQGSTRRLTFGLLVSLGLMQLFFGYIENYSFAAVGVLTYLWLGGEVLTGKKPLWLAATVLAVTHAIHPSTLVLTPSLLYCAWQTLKTSAKPEIANQRNQSTALIVLQVALPMLGVGLATLWLMASGGHGLQALLGSDRPGGSDARWFVPLWRVGSRWEHYTLFSWLHLRDWLNLHMLVAPVVLPSLVWLWAVGYRRFLRPNHPNPHIRFLSIAAIAYLIFTWVWNPDYGGQRDWDLFSLTANPATLWLIALLPINLPDRRSQWAGVMPLIVLQSLHTAAWIYQNTLPWTWPD